MTRQAVAVLGLLCVVYAEAAPGGFAPQGVVAELGVAALAIAALLAMVEPSDGRHGFVQRQESPTSPLVIRTATRRCAAPSHRNRHGPGGGHSSDWAYSA